MKRLVILIVVGLTSTASARVVMMPAVPRTCREAESWEKVTKCLERFGKPRVEREVPGAKLVGIASPKFHIPGLYLYRSVGKRWVIAGMFETSDSYEVFSLSKPTIAKRSGYRFDVGTNDEVSAPAGESAPRTIQQKISVFCPGESYFCTQVVTSCDLIVDGRARESFRGKLTIKDDRAIVKGDRSRAGTTCSSPEELDLGFAASERLPSPARILGDPLL